MTEPEVHKIEGTDNLLMQTIRDQAADLEHGWREAVQNGIDSPGADRVELEYDHERTVVRDNGEGVDIDSEKGLNLLKNLGETSKKGDETTIGEFGIGKGQIIAKGRTAFISNGSALVFDVEEWGLKLREVDSSDVGEYVDMEGVETGDGLTVVVSHYEDEVPGKGSFRWNRYETRVANRFRFAEMATGTEVYINAEAVSDDRPEGAVSAPDAVVIDNPDDVDADFVAAIEPSATGDIEVYSNGVYVKDVSGPGVSGVVVARDNLKLNFARNDIQSGCPVWSEIQPWLNDTIEELLMGLPDSRLTAGARSYLSERALSEDGFDPEKPVFKTVDGDHVSLNDLRDTDQMSFADGGDARARRLAEGWNMTILDTGDDATERLHGELERVQERVHGLAELFDVDEKADQVSLPDTHDTLLDSDVNSIQARKLAAARELASRMGIGRNVYWGESEISDAWTDGVSEIVITDSAAPSRNRAAWLPSVFRALVAQSAFRTDSRDEDKSGPGYNRRYQEGMETHWGTFAEFAEEVNRDGIESAVAGDHLL